MALSRQNVLDEPPLLHVQGISKSFPGVQALKDLSFTLRAGTVHVLCGENGAGKSTLVKILNGVHQPDSGSIQIDGAEVKIHHPIEARKLGIGMIFQELDYVPEFTIEQTLFLGKEPVTRLGNIAWKEIRRRTNELIETEKLSYRPDTKLKDLSISDIQVIEILKASYGKAKIILMDEPTSAITDSEVSALFERIGVLKRNGVGIIYISHKLDEVFQIADEITVIRDGEYIDHRPVKDFDYDSVVSLMVGRNLENIFPDKIELTPGETSLEVKQLSNGSSFQDISFNVRAGEVVGFAGLVGAGRTEVVRAVFGLDSYDTGEVVVRGKALPPKSVTKAITAGVAMLSEDRKRYGLILSRSIRENASLLVLKKYFRNGLNNWKLENKEVRSVFDMLNVKSASLETSAGLLSGGNQQKVVFSKWFLKDPDILLLDEPTRGIDVGAKFEIYKIIMELASRGKAILVISSELPELMGICDRIYVMSKGKNVAEIPRSQFSQESIMKHAVMG